MKLTQLRPAGLKNGGRACIEFNWASHPGISYNKLLSHKNVKARY
jgi:hypothetical protein